MIERLAPERLMLPSRLDLAVKHRFFRALLTGEWIDEAENLYRWHIEKRTGGKEPDTEHGGRSSKRTVDDYVTGCRELITSLKRDGFRDSSPVTLGKDGGLLHGAHRIAACRALGIQPAVRRDQTKRGIRWDERWFRSNGLSEDVVAQLVLELQELGTGEEHGA